MHWCMYITNSKLDRPILQNLIKFDKLLAIFML